MRTGTRRWAVAIALAGLAALGTTGLLAAGPAAAGHADDAPESTGSVTAYAGASRTAQEEATGTPTVEAVPGDLVENGSFESPQSPRSGLVGTFPTIPGWAETTGHGVEIQNGLAPTRTGGGAQYVELDSRGPSRIYQDLATVPGTLYRLTFAYAAHPRTAAAESSFDVTFGDATQSIAPAADGVTTWRTSGMDVRATEKLTRLTFADNTGPGRIRGLGVFLDMVSVVPLPEQPPTSS